MLMVKIFGILLQEGEALKLEKEVVIPITPIKNGTVKDIFLGGHICTVDGALLIYQQATGNYFCRVCDRIFHDKDFYPGKRI